MVRTADAHAGGGGGGGGGGLRPKRALPASLASPVTTTARGWHRTAPSAARCVSVCQCVEPDISAVVDCSAKHSRRICGRGSDVTEKRRKSNQIGHGSDAVCGRCQRIASEWGLSGCIFFATDPQLDVSDQYN